MTMPARGFPPIVGKRPRVLILGSLPSRQSILMQQYYAHPQNAFWRIMGVLLGASPAETYECRAAMLKEAGVAVWDVLDSSVRPGSMDADIVERTAVTNDIVGFLQSHEEIRAIFFNGQTAAKLFRKRLGQQLASVPRAIDLHTLPSTSPAHATLSMEEKTARWSVLQIYLE